MKKINKKLKIKKRRKKYIKIRYNAKFKRKAKGNKKTKIKNFLLISKILFIIILSIIFHKIFLFESIYKYCINCVNKIDNLDSKCLQCSNDLLFRNLYIVPTEETLNEMIKNKKSISRFSDGEFYLIYGSSIRFQEYDKNLSKRLLEIIQNNNKNKKLLVGIDFAYKKKN